MAETDALHRNFGFLVAEVLRQVERAQAMIADPDPARRHRITDRDEYINHLKSIIENKTFAYLRRHGGMDKKTVDSIRAINVITGNLERIADHAVNVVNQTTHLSSPDTLKRHVFRPFFEAILGALGEIQPAYAHQDAERARRLCEVEQQLDDLYADRFRGLLDEMAAPGPVGDSVTVLFIFHYLERMGDCLLNVGEAVLFAKIGERLKYHQLAPLERSLSDAGVGAGSRGDAELEGIWGTRSGCFIGKATGRSAAEDQEPEVIYKGGAPEKIRAEKSCIERWNELVPGLAPRIVKFEESDRDATLLLEYLSGSNFQAIALHPELGILDEAIGAVQRTLERIWHVTRVDEPARPRFLEQLRARLEEVARIHPTLRRPSQRIGGLRLASFDELVEHCTRLDESLAAPFTVFGHGDFNLDNVIYDPESRAVRFIDVHRSGKMDYLQDITVFLVSNFRTPVFDRALRQRLEHVTLAFLDFAADFARRTGDETFEARLALGLARSFVTSTRFELERDFAASMFERAVFLLEALASHEGEWERFRVPRSVLLY